MILYWFLRLIYVAIEMLMKNHSSAVASIRGSCAEEVGDRLLTKRSAVAGRGVQVAEPVGVRAARDIAMHRRDVLRLPQKRLIERRLVVSSPVLPVSSAVPGQSLRLLRVLGTERKCRLASFVS